MLFYYLLLAFGISIDSLGIGITYGIKNTKFALVSNIIVFILSFVISSIALFVGSIFSNILSEDFANIIGCIILTAMGFWLIFHPANSSDFDNSNSIDYKESIFLGFFLSLDSIGVAIGMGTLGYSSFVLPVFIAIFNIIFLNIGKVLGRNVKSKIKIPDDIWNVLSGILLIAIGFFKFL